MNIIIAMVTPQELEDLLKPLEWGMGFVSAILIFSLCWNIFKAKVI